MITNKKKKMSKSNDVESRIDLEIKIDVKKTVSRKAIAMPMNTQYVLILPSSLTLFLKFLAEKKN